MLPWVALGLLIPVAVLMLVLWRQFLLTGSRSHRQDQLLTSAWAPMLASAGLLGLVWDRSGTLGGIGSLAVGTGAMVFAIIVGSLLLAASTTARRDPWDSEERIPLAWPVAGVLMMLIAAAGRVSHTVGLVAFALGLVLLWLNLLPDKRDEGLDRTSTQEWNLAIAFLAALVLGACSRLSPETWLVPVGLVVGLAALGVIGLLARYRGMAPTIHAAGWFAVLLPCFGLGLMGQDRLLEFIRGGPLPGIPGPSPRLTETGGLLEPGLVLLVTIVVLVGSQRWTRTWRSPASMALLLAGVLGFTILLVQAAG